MNLNTALELFIVAKSGLNFSEKHLHLYRRTINILIVFLNDKDIEQVTVTDLRQFRADQAEKKVIWEDHPTKPAMIRKLSPWTILGHVRRIRTFFSWLTEEGYLQDSPAKKLERPKLPKIAPKDIRADDVAELINLNADSVRDRAIVMLLAESGCRVGGVAGLNLTDIDLNLVEGRARATVFEKSRERTIFFGADTASAINDYVTSARRADPENKALFTSNKCGTRLTTSGIYQIFKRSGKAGNIERYNPHGMRHATARRMIDAGGSIEDVSAVLGHSTSEVTKLFYSGWCDSDTRKRHTMYAGLQGAGQ